MPPEFRPGFCLSGILLSLAGAAGIVLYTLVNRRTRDKSARAHWRTGWILGAAGMTSMGAGWALLGMAGPRLWGPGIQASGATIGLLGGAIYVASARRVGRWRAPSNYSLALYTGGIHARVRHPQALALCVVAVGVGLISGSVSYLATLPLWLAFWTGYTYLEEKHELLPVFGDEYRRYAAETPRIWPRIRSRRTRRRVSHGTPEVR